MRFTDFKALTRIEQTLFALPFVLGGAFLSLPCAPLSMHWVWVLPAFLLARISGMAFNQLIDREIDARNPRTQRRAIPSGRVSVKEARMVAWGTLFLFVVVCFQINALTAALAPIAAFFLYAYSYMKRIHYTCHLVLGCIHFLGPVMTCAAIAGTVNLPALFLGAAAGLSIIGNDIVYAIQDHTFDCANGLCSIPSKFGVRKSLTISATLHCMCLIFLLAVGLSASLPLIYYGVLPVAGTTFIYFHRLLRKRRNSFVGLEGVFFYCNVAVSFSTLFFIVGSWLVLS